MTTLSVLLTSSLIVGIAGLDAGMSMGHAVFATTAFFTAMFWLVRKDEELNHE